MFGRKKKKKQRDPFYDYYSPHVVRLGYDGLEHIATVSTTPEEAQKLVDLLNAQPKDAWQKFLEKQK